VQEVMLKQILYFVIKYNNKYYTPFIDNKSYYSIKDCNDSLIDDRRLALRFGSYTLAKRYIEKVIMGRVYYDCTFIMSKLKIVTIIKKIK
jgi:hypothetical protein